MTPRRLHQLPPDDDPAFNRWLAEVGPLRDAPDEPGTGRPVVAAIAVSAAVLGLGLALAVAWTLAVGLVTVLIAALFIVGGVTTAVLAVIVLIRLAS